MAQVPPNFSTWSSSSSEAAANLCTYEFNGTDHTSHNIGSADVLSMDHIVDDHSVWQQLERVSALHYPSSQLQIQLPDTVLGPSNVDESQYDSGQVSFEFHSGTYNDVESYSDLLNGFPETVSPALDQITNTPVINRSFPNNTRSLPAEEVFPSLDHPAKAAAVPAKLRTGRRRRGSTTQLPDGWVASKNLISERRRREKLQAGLITLRELVPMFNMKMDKVSIISDAISHLKDLKRIVEKLESADSNDHEPGRTTCNYVDPLNTTSELVTQDLARSSCTGWHLGSTSSDAENGSETRKLDSPTDGSFSNSDDSVTVQYYDYESSPSSRDRCPLHKIQKMDVTKLDHGVYKLDFICVQQSGTLVQLSRAIEAFVIEIVNTSIVAITSTMTTCNFVVKMSSWNDMTLGDVRADIKTLLGNFGLQFNSESNTHC